MSENEAENTFSGIAIIGMSGRFPGAKNIAQFWQNLRTGKESIKFFTDEELKASEPDFEILKNDPNYVRARGVLENIDCFDAGFFGYSPKEAAILDPQQRLWLECAWEALENAGYDPESYEGLIGVFAGGSFLDSYLLHNLCRNRQHTEMLVRMRSSEAFSSILNNSMGFMPTRTSYKLNLRGPSVNVQTACSTSLVAVCLACQSLSNYDSDMCLAGGVSILVPQEIGYYYEEGGIPSPDGHCRPFDAAAKGTVLGNGLGNVILKRLEDALEDRDNILAVIRGWGMNNDGSHKLSYSAPSVEGQAEAIAMAQAMSGIDPETITYIEAHGTGTALGDPVEVAALTRAFRAKTKALQFCGIGSVKGNVGHLDAAAGVTGLIKTVLSLQHREIPPSLHYKSPNPEIDFARSPFYVVDTLKKWQTNGMPRRAGVSSFGIGGTNAHVVLEEAPFQESAGDDRPWQLLVLSARTEPALGARIRQLADYMEANPKTSLADAAFTLSVGRKTMNWRRAVVCRDPAEVSRTFNDSPEGAQIFTGNTNEVNPEVVFMFPGQGSEHVNMGLDLYRGEKAFRHEVDRCLEIAAPYHELDLRKAIYPGEEAGDERPLPMNRQSIAQSAIFITEYALARLWQKWGIHPSAFVGHSIGEYTAACLAGVFTLEDALLLVAARGRLMEEMGPGSMLAVSLTEQEVGPYLDEDVSIAVVNGPSLCVLSGALHAVERLEARLLEQKVDHKRLRVAHAFHSSMTEPVLGSFRNVVERVNLNPPQVPFVCNLTGTWAKTEQVTSPVYWVNHLRHTVRFSDGVKELLKEKRIFLEVGPGQTLETLVKMHLDGVEGRTVISSMRHPKDPVSDFPALLNALGGLWLCGVQPNWPAFYDGQQRRRIPLPSYPFERKRYWIEPEKSETVNSGATWGAIREEDAVESDETEVKEERVEKKSGFTSLSAVEQAVTGMWRDLLGHDEIGPGDNFFDLGGHSLIALRLLSRIEKAFGKRLPMATLITHPTIHSLARLIAKDDFVPSWASLVPVQPHGSRPPFFCIHSEGGNVLEYYRLAEYLGVDQPFYALQTLGLKGDRIESYSVEEMADHYLSEMKEKQPKGPYYIGGYCLGGLIAYEMARQLEGTGEKVAFLGLISSSAPEHLGKEIPKITSLHRLLYRIMERGELEVANLRVLDIKGKRSYIQERARRIGVGLKLKWEGMYASAPKSLRLRVKEASRPYILEKLREAQERAFYRFQPLPIKARITLFRVSRQSRALQRDPLLGWAGLSGEGIEDYEIPAFHKNILKDPQVKLLSEKMNVCLKNAIAGDR